MKIAFIDVYNPIPINSGGDWYRFQLLDELGKLFDTVEYYMVEEYNKKGYRPDHVSFERKHIDSKVNWKNISKKLEILKPEYLIKYSELEQINADIIIFSTICYHIAKGISKTKYKPIVLVMHNVEWQYLKSNGSYIYIPLKYYENYIIKQADAVVSLSPNDYDYASKLIGKEKLFYIPPKVDTSIFNKTGDVFNFGKDRMNLLFYGSLDREQNIDALNFIVNKLIPAMKSEGIMNEMRINVFGSGVPPKFLVDCQDINFLGLVEDPGKYVRGADIVIVPVKNIGGMKIRILESIACGKPVIAMHEAASGIPGFLKEFVFIANSADEFIKIIRSMEGREISYKSLPNSVDSYLKGDKLEDVIDYVKEKSAVLDKSHKSASRKSLITATGNTLKSILEKLSNTAEK